MGLAQHLTSFINLWGLGGLKQVSSEGQESQASALLTHHRALAPPGAGDPGRERYPGFNQG